VKSLAEQTLSHYRIVERIGEAGTGEVYRARDTRIDREVALKALPDPLASDPERLSRFVRDARILASLNHPHIGAIYGIEDSPRGGRFLVQELVEGETLAERLRRGPLPLVESLRICGRIADALEAAHRAGVAHRDLKPGKVMLSRRGAVKVLDFGLAHHASSSAVPASPGPDPAGTRIAGAVSLLAPPSPAGPE